MKIVGVPPIPEETARAYVAAGLWDDIALRDGIEAQATRRPEAVAISDAASTWSYQQLEQAIANATGCLREHGVAGKRILLVVPLMARSVAAYHAVVRSGAVAVMLDRRSGRADVEHAIDAADVSLIIATPELADGLELEATGLPVLSFEELVSWSEPFRDWTEPDPNEPVAIVFTSGTTSRPKGVVHCLNTLRSGARSMADALGLNDSDVAFLSTPLASITGLVQVHLTLDRGAGLLLEDRFDAVGSLARLCAEGATVLGGAPVIIEELFKQAQAQDLHDLPLRAICLGGSMIPRPILELAINRYGISPVRLYGSSEVPCATATRASDVGEARLGDDGGCARGTELRTDGELPGELLVRGPMRFLGYLDAQDNAGTFTDGGWYRSGDLGRFEDGRLTVTGRLKEIVARKGLKISLTEIDEVMQAVPGVQEVAAFGVPDPDTGERLAVAVRSSDPAAIEFEQVTAWLLGAGLAKWKLPEQIVVWDGPLPRTASGKIQRRLIAADEEPRRTMLAPRLR